jgi:hypothetical protein
MTIKARLTLGAATGALLALCSCGREQAAGADPMAND